MNNKQKLSLFISGFLLTGVYLNPSVASGKDSCDLILDNMRDLNDNRLSLQLKIRELEVENGLIKVTLVGLGEGRGKTHFVKKLADNEKTIKRNYGKIIGLKSLSRALDKTFKQNCK